MLANSSGTAISPRNAKPEAAATDGSGQPPRQPYAVRNRSSFRQTPVHLRQIGALSAMDIVTTSNFHATLLRGRVSVVFVPAEFIRQSSWPLLNLLLYGGCGFDENENGCVVAESHICRSVQTEIFAVTWDRDGATLYMDPSGIDMFKRAGVEEMVTIAPQHWRAIQIHLGPMVAEFPGVVSFLSKLLAEDHISILNMSTYDTDVIYVQEQDLETAITCLQSKLSRGLHGLKEAKDAESAREPVSPVSTDDTEAKLPSLEAGEALSMAPIVDSGQYLVVYPESLVLVRLQKEALRENAYGLTQLVLMSEAPGDSELPSESGGLSFWCYCETAEEVSLIMHERCLSAFSEESIIVSPDRWRAIKLGGRSYGFDETGVVAAMSGCSTDTQVLNVSCFASNVTFVLDHMLDESLAVLCDSLQISRVVR